MLPHFVGMLLLPLLGAEDYETREWAQVRLTALNNASDIRPLIRRQIETNDDAEIVKRLRDVLDDYYDLGPLPTRPFADYRVRGRLALDFPVWEAARAETGWADDANTVTAYVRRLLDSRPRAEVLRIVRDAWALEAKQCVKEFLVSLVDAL